MRRSKRSNYLKVVLMPAFFTFDAYPVVFVAKRCDCKEKQPGAFYALDSLRFYGPTVDVIVIGSHFCDHVKYH